MVEFINKVSRTDRKLDGFLGDNAGRISGLDDISRRFVASADRSGDVETAKEVVSGLQDSQRKDGEYYLRVMKNIQEKGDDFVSKELARLSRMRDGGRGVDDEKIDNFSKRINILKAFQ
mmetsp:Transcript_7901/g.20568  ORF Transcript_7901/g.20568 Transcript_7901/m.20568 type:complete len:119 (+) Transcript_7901:468-824(+)